MPIMINKLKSRGHVIVDMYKFEKPELPTHGGIVVVFTVFFVSSLMPLFNRILQRLQILDYGTYSINEVDIAILLVISIFGIFGILDDLLHISWGPKVLLPICFSFPLMIVFSPQSIILPFYGEFDLSRLLFFGIDYSDLFKVLIAPIYVMVVANLINMHSGFNGLQSGLSSILLATVVIKSIIEGDTNNLSIPIIFLGGMTAFWFYNKYPAQIFEGNIGPLVVGASIGTLIVTKGLFVFGIFILLPHITDFLMLMYYRLNSKPFVKFGELRDDGTIRAPNPFKMKFLLPFYFNLSEKQTVIILYCITIFFCIGGLLLF